MTFFNYLTTYLSNLLKKNNETTTDCSTILCNAESQNESKTAAAVASERAVDEKKLPVENDIHNQLAEAQVRLDAESEESHKYQVLEDDLNVFVGQTAAGYLVSFLAVIYGIENEIGILNTWSDWLVCGIAWWLGVAYWLKDMEEDIEEGEVTLDIITNILFATLMFISSEALFFAGFFWGFFHLSLNASAEMGAAWPPVYMYNANYLYAPMLNSLLLLSSGVSATLAHTYSNDMFVKFTGCRDAALGVTAPTVAKIYYTNNWLDNQLLHSKWNRRNYKRNRAVHVGFTHADANLFLYLSRFNFVISAQRARIAGWLLVDTLLRGVAFMGVQVYEYTESAFTISDNAYSSVFFMITGLHGLHVGVGLLALALCTTVLFSSPELYIHWENRIGLLAAIWYWHFVDVVWLFVLLFLYYDVPAQDIRIRIHYQNPNTLLPSLYLIGSETDAARSWISKHN